MICYIMRSLLLIFALALVNSQARTLTEKQPWLAISARPAGVATSLLESFVHRGTKAPPPPKSATPVIEMMANGSNNWTLQKNYEKKERLPPPAPKDASPTHPSIRWWSGGAAARAIIAQLSSV